MFERVLLREYLNTSNTKTIFGLKESIFKLILNVMNA